MRVHFLALVLVSVMGLSACADETTATLDTAGSPAVSQSEGISVSVVVRPGDTGAAVAAELEASGVVAASEFYELAVSDPRAKSIQPGTYQLRTGMTAQAALEGLLDPSSLVGESVSVEPGERLTETVAKVAEATGRPIPEVASAFEEVFPSGAEGLLGVATYQVLPGDTPRAIAEQMRQAFAPTLQRAEELASASGRTATELLTIASILPNEVYASDWRKAARVIENRLAEGMPLQLDSTVAYAAGVRRLELTVDELEAPHPYNTYTNSGLPPGPIGAVSEAALEAAATPESGAWLYWVTVDPDTGETVFAVTYEEFLEGKDRYREWLSQRP